MPILSPRARSMLLNLGRAALSVGLLAWILARAGLQPLIATLRAGDPLPYLAAIALALLGIVLRAWRWLILLRAVNARLSFRRAVYLYFVGAFFNAFLPTGFGGDVVRVLEAGQGADSAQAAGTVVVDRLTGFVALFWMALAALPWAVGLLPAATLAWIAALALGVTAGGVLLVQGRWLRALSRWLPGPLALSGDGWLARTYGVITACGPRAIAGALGVSVLFNLLQVGANALASQALLPGLPAALFFLFVPITSAALLAPITISGLGVREGMYVALFAQVGVGPAQAVALSLAAYSLDLVTGLAGGVIYLGAGVAGLRK